MKLTSLLTLTILLSSCAISNPPQGPGIIITNSRELIFYDPTVSPESVTEVCGTNILGVVSFGDNGLASIKASGIQKIYSIERTYENFLLLYGKSCLVVSGK